MSWLCNLIESAKKNKKEMKEMARKTAQPAEQDARDGVDTTSPPQSHEDQHIVVPVEEGSVLAGVPAIVEPHDR